MALSGLRESYPARPEISPFKKRFGWIFQVYTSAEN